MWKTTSKRYVPAYKTHPRSWREQHLGLEVENKICAQCDHSLNIHFSEENCNFCQISDCECNEKG